MGSINPISKRIKMARLQLGYSRKEFATNYGIPSATLQAWETARYPITTKGLQRYINALSTAGLTCTQPWILYGTPPAPNLILEKARDIVIDTFSESVENVQDGMDIAICSLNTKTKELQYAGANNPLWIIRKNSDVIEEYKANKYHIGKCDMMKPFTNHSIQLNDGDTIYIFSDGYPDQFGGPKGKKLKSKPFKNLLLSIYNQPLDEQKELLDNHFEQWKGDLEQIDDVCVIGVKI